MAEIKYQLTDLAKDTVSKPKVRIRLMVLFGVTEFTIVKYISKNNPILTTWGVLKIIMEVTGEPLHSIVEIDNRPVIKQGRPIKTK